MEIYAQFVTFDDLLLMRINKDLEVPDNIEIDNSLFQDVEQIVKRYSVFDENSCVLQISPDFDSIGNILWASKNSDIIFGFSMNDFTSMNIMQLMPSYIGLFHSKILKNFYETCRERMTNNINHTFGQDMNGYLFSMNLSVKMIPGIVTYSMMGFIHQINTQDYMMLDSDGLILGVGIKVAEILQVSPKFFLNYSINI